MIVMQNEKLIDLEEKTIFHNKVDSLIRVC